MSDGLTIEYPKRKAEKVSTIEINEPDLFDSPICDIKPSIMFIVFSIFFTYD